jgi:hypothetical protein
MTGTMRTPVSRYASAEVNARFLHRSSGPTPKTTGREDAAGLIHVALEEDTLVRHLPTLLGKAAQAGGEWALVRIDTGKLQGRVFPDPATDSAFFLAVKEVPPKALQVVRTGKLPRVILPGEAALAGAPGVACSQ